MSSTAERHDVVIAGGGTAGLALACALADALGSGARIAVADRAPLRPGTVAAEPRANPHAHLMEIPGSDHFVFATRTGLVNDTLEELSAAPR